LLAAILLASGLASAGCGAKGEAEALFEPTPTPGIVRVGTPVEIEVSESVGCLFNATVEGDLLVAPARLNEEIRMAVVNLATGEAHRLNVEGIRVSSGPVRYVAQVRDVEPRANLAELLVYDLSEGKTLTVAEGQLRRPHVSDDILVWEEHRGDGMNIYGYDLSQKRRFTVAEGRGVRTFPQVASDWVVYLFWDHEEQPLHMLRAHHVPTGDDFEIGLMPMKPGDYPPSRFRVSGSRVAWIGVKWGEIHVYDLEARTDEIVFIDERPSAVLVGLEMAGDLIMWGGGSQGIVGYDLVHRRLFEIPDLPEEVQIRSRSVLISESYVVWPVEEVDPLVRFFITMTPPPPGEPMPTPPPEVLTEVEAGKCQRRLFVAPIIRQ